MEKIFWGYFSYTILGWELQNLFHFLFSGTRNILKIGKNYPQIANLEFECHVFLENNVFHPAEQTGTNLC